MIMTHTSHARRSRTARRLGTIAAVVALGAAAGSASAATSIRALAPGTSPLAGIQDDRAIQVDPMKRFKMMADAGARIARIDLRWDHIAKARPANPVDPADPAYDWSVYDGVVAAARRHKMEVLFTVWGTPGWAVDQSMVPLGDTSFGMHTFPPKSAEDFRTFSIALARRYTSQGVRKWEGWNEPNVPIFLQPQYRRVNGVPVPASPAIYSDLQKAFYSGIKLVNRRAQIGGIVTSPAGDKTSNDPVRVIPMTFVKELNKPGLRPPMDFVSHHPYPVRPRTDKRTPSGRSYSDLYNLDEMTKAIDSTYLRGKKLWLTEYGFSTARVPEYTMIVSPAVQADNIGDAYWRMKTNRRVGMAIYYFLQDHPGWRSGLLNMNLSKKPAYQAHALPLWPRKVGRATNVYGQVRDTNKRTRVTIQEKRGARWVAARAVTTAPDGSFVIQVRTTGRATLRAHWKGRTRANTPVVRVSRPVTVR